MSILRVFPGANDKEIRLKGLIRYIVACPEKRQWHGVYFAKNQMLYGYGIPDHGTLEELYAAFILPHIAYGYPGTRLCYHCLLDFNGLVGVNDASVIAWEINQFLRQYQVQFLQGIHVTKANGQILWPHAHVLINTITLFGPNQGRKFRLEKPILRSYKEHMNMVLKRYGLPIISIYERLINDEFADTNH